MIALRAFERLLPGDWRRFGVGAVAVLLAYFTRSAGLPRVLAALTWLGRRRRWQHAAALAALIGLPALLWSLRGRALGRRPTSASSGTSILTCRCWAPSASPIC
jgi:hypothetical protein